MLGLMSKKSWGNNWVVQQLSVSREYQPKSQNYINEKKLFNCPSCKTAWEVYKHQHILYQDFPKYGLDKEICPQCR